MKLLILSLVMALISSSVFADNYVVPNDRLNHDAIEQVLKNIEAIAPAGNYTGKTPSGETCEVKIYNSTDRDGNNFLDMSAPSRFYLNSNTDYNPQYRYYLINQTLGMTPDGDQQFNLAVMVFQTERQSFILILDMKEKNGSLSSVQYSFIFANQQMAPGDVFTEAEVNHKEPCNELTKTN